MKRPIHGLSLLLFAAALGVSAAGSGEPPASAAREVKVIFSTNEDYDTSIYGSDGGIRAGRHQERLV